MTAFKDLETSDVQPKARTYSQVRLSRSLVRLLLPHSECRLVSSGDVFKDILAGEAMLVLYALCC